MRCLEPRVVVKIVLGTVSKVDDVLFDTLETRVEE